MSGELVEAFMLHVDGNPTAVISTLEEAKSRAQSYIEAGQDVSVQTTSGRIVEWYFDRAQDAWVFTEQPQRRPGR